MLAVIFVLLGIGAEIVKANEWFIIPSHVSWICFGISAFICLCKIINYFSVKREVSKMNKKFRAW